MFRAPPPQLPTRDNRLVPIRATSDRPRATTRCCRRPFFLRAPSHRCLGELMAQAHILAALPTQSRLPATPSHVLTICVILWTSAATMAADTRRNPGNTSSETDHTLRNRSASPSLPCKQRAEITRIRSHTNIRISSSSSSSHRHSHSHSSSTTATVSTVPSLCQARIWQVRLPTHRTVSCRQW